MSGRVRRTRGSKFAHRSSQKRTRLSVELLEPRQLLSAAAAVPQALELAPATGGAVSILEPAQVRHAYGFDQVSFASGTVAADGSGQTIALVEAGDDPNIVNDLHVFDQRYGLPDPPSFVRLNQAGGGALPAPAGSAWVSEIALDVEWAHAIAPGASILLVETNSNSSDDLMAGVDVARNTPGVIAVSMSWAIQESAGLTRYDGHFTTPPGHVGGYGRAGGVVFVTSAGDYGAAATWPAVSPYVLSVGGTTLSADSSGNYLGESVWSHGSGGMSAYEGRPAYQAGVSPYGMRSAPDVSYNAGYGFEIYNSYANPYGWMAAGGTSAGSPQMAALVAIVDQGRAITGQGSLDGFSGLLPLLYSLPASDFHDITTGGDGYWAAPGYDLASGRGSPMANRIIRDLTGSAAAAPAAAAPPGRPTTQPSRAPQLPTGPAYNTAITDAVAGSGSIVFTVTGDHALYRRDVTWGWVKLGDPGSVAAVSTATESSGNVVAFVLTTDHGLSRYDPATGWTRLGGAGSIRAVSAGSDSSGRANVFAVTTDGGLSEFDPWWGWARLGDAGTVTSVSAASLGRATVVTMDGGVSAYDNAHGWSRLAGASFARSVSAVNDGWGVLSVFAVSQDGGMYRYRPDSGWQKLGAAGTIASVSAGQDAGGHADVVAITTGGALAEFADASGWWQLAGPGGARRAAAGMQGRVAFVGGDGSVREYDGRSGWLTLSGGGFAMG